METKICPYCDRKKLLDEFYDDKWYGSSSYCKLCKNIYLKKIREGNKNKIELEFIEKKEKWGSTKKCNVCEEEQPINFFAVAKRNKDGLEHQCKICRAAIRAKKIANSRPTKKRYSLTKGQYEVLVKKQNNLCFICQQPDNKGKRLAIDHDHNCCPDRRKSCGKCVRGLLCSNHNLALGMFGDDVEIFKRVINYLENGAANVQAILAEQS